MEKSALDHPLTPKNIRWYTVSDSQTESSFPFETNQYGKLHYTMVHSLPNSYSVAIITEAAHLCELLHCSHGTQSSEPHLDWHVTPATVADILQHQTEFCSVAFFFWDRQV